MFRIFLNILIFSIIVVAFYAYIGNSIPQIESRPPEEVEIASNLTAEELVNVGKEIFYGKGTCALCHSIGQKGLRCPDLAGVGARAAERKEGMSAEEYLAESLYDPGAYIVEGYENTMPQINKPPVGLSGKEIVAVIAFLQSLGGVTTVTAETAFPQFSAGEAPPMEETPPAPAGVGVAAAEDDPEKIMTAMGCPVCHDYQKGIVMVGPSLKGAGSRRDRGYIERAILDPNAEVAEGFPPGVMPGDYASKLTVKQFNILVDFLIGLGSGETGEGTGG